MFTLLRVALSALAVVGATASQAQAPDLSGLLSPAQPKPGVILLWSSNPSSAQTATARSAAGSAAPSAQVDVVNGSSLAVRRAIGRGEIPAAAARRPKAEDLVAAAIALGADALVAVPEEASDEYVVVATAAGVRRSLPADATEQAIVGAIRDVLAAPRSSPDALYTHGRILAARGELGAAADALASAVQAAPNQVEYRVAYARALRAAGRPRMADTEVRTAAKQQPKNPLVQMAVAEMEASHGRWIAAMAAATAAANASDPPLGIHKLLGDLCLATGRSVQACEEYKLAGKQVGALKPLAQLLLRQGQWDDAISAASDALALAPDDTDVRATLASAYSGACRYPEAIIQRATIITQLAEHVSDSAESTRSGASAAAIHRGPPTLPPATEEFVARQVRGLLTDVLSGCRDVAYGTGSRTQLYRAMQESLIAADRLRAELASGPTSPATDEAGAHRALAYALWSQASYDLIKALEGTDTAALSGPLDLVSQAVDELDQAAKAAMRARSRK